MHKIVNATHAWMIILYVAHTHFLLLTTTTTTAITTLGGGLFLYYRNDFIHGKKSAQNNGVGIKYKEHPRAHAISWLHHLN